MKMLCKLVIMSALVMTAAFAAMAQQDQQRAPMMGQGQGGMMGQGQGGMMGRGQGGMMGQGQGGMMGQDMGVQGLEATYTERGSTATEKPGNRSKSGVGFLQEHTRWELRRSA